MKFPEIFFICWIGNDTPAMNKCSTYQFTYKVFQKQSSGVLKDAVLKIFAKFTGKHLCWFSF